MERPRADRILADWDRISRQARRPDLPPRRAVTTALPASTIAGAALLVLIVVAAGLWIGLPPGVGQPGAQASASPVVSSPLVEASASPVEPSPSPVDASASPVDTWGPLAVVPPDDGADTLRFEGTLRITDTCVFLESPYQGRHLLIWDADQATWNGESRAITFENFDGTFVTVSDGDHVVLGGSGGGAASGTGEEFVIRMDWVAPPASSCSLDPWWSVGAVVPVP